MAAFVFKIPDEASATHPNGRLFRSFGRVNVGRGSYHASYSYFGTVRVVPNSIFSIVNALLRVPRCSFGQQFFVPYRELAGN